MDLHQGQIQGFFEIPVDHMTAVPMLADYFRYKDFGGTPIVAVSADAGGVKLAKRFINRMPDASLAVLTKMRPEHNRAETMHFIGDVQDKIAIIVDDMIDTAGSITAAIETLYENGAKEVYVTATHGIFSGPAFERIRRLAGQRGRRHRHRARGARSGRHQDQGAHGGRHPGPHHQERVRGRVGERAVRRREPAFLAGD